MNTEVARVVVRHANGIDDSLPALDQTTNGARWNRLGTYFLYEVSYVELADVGSPCMIADAVRFTSLESVNLPAIEPAELPIAYAGAEYSAQLAVVGGIAPYVWSLAGGSLPPGITLNAGTGRLGGIPENPGLTPAAYPFTAKVVDGGGNEAVHAFEIVVAAPGTFMRASVNFQPAGAPIPAGYLPDTGEAFADRGNGLSYGWNVDNRGNVRDRNNAASPDQRYDTLNHLQQNGTFFWELAVPNGRYEVRVVAGDPRATTTPRIAIVSASRAWSPSMGCRAATGAGSRAR